MAEGISEERITLSKGRNWVKFEATIAEAEYLLKTEYKIYESKDGLSKRSLATDEYSVPLAIRDHIDFITPTVQFDAVFSKRNAKKQALPGLEKSALKEMPILDLKPGKTGPYVTNSSAPTNLKTAFTPTDLSLCDQFITTECLRALYNMPNGTLANSSITIVEYTPQSFVAADLTTYLSNMDPWIPSTTQPHVDFVDGAVLVADSGDNVESNLDLQLAVPLGKSLLLVLATWTWSNFSSFPSGSLICSSRRHDRIW
jgi:tripeptidyl-peptidase-1